MKQTKSAIAVDAVRISSKSSKESAARGPIVQLVTDLVGAATRGSTNKPNESQSHSDTDALEAGGTKEPITVRLLRANLMLMLILCAGTVVAQTSDVPKSPYSYHNDIFIGGSFMMATAGPSLSSVSFGGWNISATHHFTPLLGFAADVQGPYGHVSISSSQLLANAFVY